MKVLYISYDGMTDPLGQSQVIPYLSGLQKNGHEIHLLSCEKKEKFDAHEREIQAILDQEGIQWYPVSYSKNPPVLATVWDIMKLRKKANAICINASIEAVHCRSYIAGMIGEMMKRAHGVKFIFDIRGFWTDERVDGGLWSLSNPVYKRIYNYFKKKEKLLFKSADAVVTLTSASKRYIAQHFAVTDSIFVIPCAADLNLFVPQQEEVRAEFRKKIGAENSFVLLYLGSVGTWYLLKEMLAFFKVLKEKKTNAKFVFISAEDPDFIYKNAKDLGIDEEDVIVKKSSRNDVPKWISIADLSVFFIKDCFSKMASSPTKHGELLGANVPVVCNDIGDLKEIVAFKDAGVIVEGFNRSAYLKAIDHVGKTNSKEKTRATAEEFYSLKKGVKTYVNVYESVAKKVQ